MANDIDDSPPLPEPDYRDEDSDSAPPWDGADCDPLAPMPVAHPADLAWITGVELGDAIEPDGAPTLSELGNARRLVAMHGEDLRHCGGLPGSGWLTWDGSRWAPDLTGHVHRYVQRLPEIFRAEADALRREAKALREADDSTEEDMSRAATLEALAKSKSGWATRCESARTLASSLALLALQSTVPVLLSQLDADPWLLGTPGAVLDLRTGEPREPHRSDLITRSTGAAWEDEADCPTWRRFLSDIMGGDQALIDYLQRAVGYSLTGTTSEQVLLVCHGSGANGKSTFLETLRALAGDYGRNVPADSLVGRREGTIPNDLAMLAGARFVTASESAENRPLDEALVKALTGGEPVTARFLNREFFDFQPQFTLWLATNHKPRVKGTDHGIWRRIHLIPFRVTIQRDQMDRDLGRKLREESAGILRWAIEGLLEWQRVGLAPPAAVLDATADYRTEQDVVAEFLDQSAVLESAAISTSAAVYAAYQAWAKDAGEFPRSSRWLAQQLQARGVEPYRTGHARCWRGLRLLTSATTPERSGRSPSPPEPSPWGGWS